MHLPHFGDFHCLCLVNIYSADLFISLGSLTSFAGEAKVSTIS